ncbi:MAG: single-stranded DNA-binding protein [Oscillospiraceae bacterium]|nr:single-stranded DNA-binding protein [Oscillospiraceae bacterium]
MNKAILMGRLTADPELRTTPNGISVTSFSIAVDRRFTQKGAEKQTDFINIVAWRHTAEFISKYFSKGNMIALEGSIQTRNYEDKNGNKRTAVEVVAENSYFTGSKAESTSSGSAPKFNEPAEPGTSISIGDNIDFQEVEPDDGLPF